MLQMANTVLPTLPIRTLKILVSSLALPIRLKNAGALGPRESTSGPKHKEGNRYNTKQKKIH